ncbi:MAG: hypothetical protein ABIT08_14790 [Bacteroidia bacterium]
MKVYYSYAHRILIPDTYNRASEDDESKASKPFTCLFRHRLVSHKRFLYFSTNLLFSDSVVFKTKVT